MNEANQGAPPAWGDDLFHRRIKSLLKDPPADDDIGVRAVAEFIAAVLRERHARAYADTLHYVVQMNDFMTEVCSIRAKLNNDLLLRVLDAMPWLRDVQHDDQRGK